ncbi:MAG: penicillin-binding transpeptidase domain-containing protein [Actinomycetes bacterium]
MGRRVRFLALVLLLCFGGVIVQLVNIQVVQQKKLSQAAGNPKVREARLTQSRGEILAADGTVLAKSILDPKAKRGDYKFERSYPQANLYGHLIGFDSYIYGRWGIEDSYNSYLIAHQQEALSLSEILNPVTSTNTVLLSIIPALQKVAASQLAGRDGAVVALDPRTGAVLAMYSNPTFDPNPLVSKISKTEQDAWAAYNLKDAAGFAPLASLAYQRTFAPGSTFKTVTSAATYDLSAWSSQQNLSTHVFHATSSNKPDPVELRWRYLWWNAGANASTLLRHGLCPHGFRSHWPNPL